MKNLQICTATVLALATCQLSAQWNQETPATAPTARFGGGMAFDLAGGRLVMFGGTAGFSTSNETWSFQGTTWTQLAPTASPSGKTGVELVYDGNRGVMVMYGGLNTSPFGGSSQSQHWEFDGTTWTQIFPATTPGGLGAYGASYDTIRNRTILYGGTADTFFPIAESGTWEFNGTTWSMITTTGTPGPLEHPAMCFHLGIGKTVLFGGIDPQTGGVDTTWLYDGTNWTAAPISGSKPSPRSRAKMTYDTVRGVCVLTGGTDPIMGQPIVDTWEFDGTAWTQMPTATSARIGHAMAFLPTVRQVVLFGGTNPVTFTDLGDTWLYGAKSRLFGTGCAGTNGVPALAAVDAPRLGQNYVLNLTNLVPSSAFGLWVIGLTAPTPVSLTGFGMPNCFQYVAADVITLRAAISGTSTLTSALPNVAAFAGINIFHQGVSFDTAANTAGLTVSNAHAGVIGR